MPQLLTQAAAIAVAIVQLPALWVGRWWERFRQAGKFRRGMMLFKVVVVLMALAGVAKVTVAPAPNALETYQSLDPAPHDLSAERQREVLRTKNDLLFSDRVPGVRENQYDYIDDAIDEGPASVECLNQLYDADAAAVVPKLAEDQAQAWQALLSTAPRAGGGIRVAGEASNALEGFFKNLERLEREQSWVRRAPVECDLSYFQ